MLGYAKLIGAALVLVAIAGAVIYVEHLKAARDEALVQVASLQATNNELTAVHANDVKALADLAAAKAQSEAALLADAQQQRTVTDTVVQWKERVVHVKVASDACRAADARDAAVLDGVRDILAGAAAADPNGGSQGDAAAGAARGHPAAVPAGAAPKP